MMLLAEMEVDTFCLLIGWARCQIHASTIIDVSNRLCSTVASTTVPLPALQHLASTTVPLPLLAPRSLRIITGD